MEHKNIQLKKLLLGGILVVLLLPLVLQFVHFYTPKPLKGSQTKAEKIWFSKDVWYSGEYQKAYEAWHAENVGFRADYVRLHNQIEYSLFGKISAQAVVEGKDGYLYEENYMKTYAGLDFVGLPLIEKNAERLKLLQDSLEKKGITLIVCLAAGKASFYPEYLPDEYAAGSDSTNYKVYAAVLKKHNVNLIDYNDWFMKMKGKTEFPLYPKTGIHWSRYGSLKAVDSLIKYVEKKKAVDLPSVVWEKTVWGDTMQSPDNDIGDAMNLLFPIEPIRLGYPVYHFEDTTGKAKLRMLAFSDSFFWSMYDISLAPSSFEEINFYYYNNELYHSTGGPKTSPNILMTLEDVENSDVVVLMATEATLYGFGWGFIDDAFNSFVLHKAVVTEDALIQKYKALIQMDEKWISAVRKKAEESKIPLDSMIYLDAKYMANEALKEQRK